jgi:hypothetical protein
MHGRCVLDADWCGCPIWKAKDGRRQASEFAANRAQPHAPARSVPAADLSPFSIKGNHCRLCLRKVGASDPIVCSAIVLLVVS